MDMSRRTIIKGMAGGRGRRGCRAVRRRGRRRAGREFTLAELRTSNASGAYADLTAGLAARLSTVQVADVLASAVHPTSAPSGVGAFAGEVAAPPGGGHHQGVGDRQAPADHDHRRVLAVLAYLRGRPSARTVEPLGAAAGHLPWRCRRGRFGDRTRPFAPPAGGRTAGRARRHRRAAWNGAPRRTRRCRAGIDVEGPCSASPERRPRRAPDPGCRAAGAQRAVRGVEG